MIAAETSIPADQIEDAYHGEMGAAAQASVGQAYGTFSGYRDASAVDQCATMIPDEIRTRVELAGHMALAPPETLRASLGGVCL